MSSTVPSSIAEWRPDVSLTTFRVTSGRPTPRWEVVCTLRWPAATDAKSSNLLAYSPA
jgi:hypothetical protein